MELKKHNKYSIDAKNKLVETSPEDNLKIQLSNELKKEANDLMKSGNEINIHKMKDWK